MNICIFTENYIKGGLDTFVVNLLNGWPHLSDCFSFVCNESHPGINTIRTKVRRPIKIIKYINFFTANAVDTDGLNKFTLHYTVQVLLKCLYRLLEYPALVPIYIVVLRYFFVRNEFDRLMVVNGGYPASLLCRCAVIAWALSGKERLAVMNFHNYASAPAWYSSHMENLIDKYIVRFSSHIVSVSNDCLLSLRLRKEFDSAEQVSFIYNGIEPPSILSDESVVALNDNSENYCLMLASYEARKGHSYLLEAFELVTKRFPSIKLRIYGHGAPQEIKRVSDEIKRLNLSNSVTLGDFIADVSTLISGARLVVVPSQSYESFGLTIIEAMAYGIPVVATDVGGIPEVLADNAGYVCSRADPAMFADSIITILDNPMLAAEFGRNGRTAFADKFTAKVMAQNYAQLLR